MGRKNNSIIKPSRSCFNRVLWCTLGKIFRWDVEYGPKESCIRVVYTSWTFSFYSRCSNFGLTGQAVPYLYPAARFRVVHNNWWTLFPNIASPEGTGPMNMLEKLPVFFLWYTTMIVTLYVSFKNAHHRMWYQSHHVRWRICYRIDPYVRRQGFFLNQDNITYTVEN